VVAVVSLDPGHHQGGWIHLDLDLLGIPADQALEVDDIVNGDRYVWQGHRNFVELSPPYAARVLVLRRRLRTERDFDYFA
jgi:starch synthase (maltosyl-transferring)